MTESVSTLEAMKFLSDNWIAILSLLVALMGGIPGVITVIDHYRNRPIFTFDLVVTTAGEIEVDSPKRLTAVLLSGTVSNDGVKPLTPAYFDLRGKIPSGWIQFDRIIIPPDVVFTSGIQELEIERDKLIDLQRFSGAISQGMPVPGHLMFVTDKVNLNALQKMIETKGITWELTCYDVFDRAHAITIISGVQKSGGHYSPAHGTIVRSKSSK